MSSVDQSLMSERPAAGGRARAKRSAGWLFVAFLLPTFVFLFGFTYWPLITSAFHSLELWDLNHPVPKWTGFANYAQQFSDPTFQIVIRNTAVYILIATPLSIAVGLVTALAVNGSSKLRLAARALIFHPVLLPIVAIAAIWLFLLDPVSGPLPIIISNLFHHSPNFLGSPGLSLVTVALIGVYKNCGLYMLFFLAGLQAIPPDLTDAARKVVALAAGKAAA